MTKREKILVHTLGWIALFSLAAILFFSGLMKSLDIERSILNYRSQSARLRRASEKTPEYVASRIENLNAQIADLERKNETEHGGISAFGGDIKNRLLKYGNTVERYQIIKNDSSKLFEFAIRAIPYDFFKYLRDADDEGWQTPFISLRISGDGSVAEITFRTIYEK
jgi:hypothetical protein